MTQFMRNRMGKEYAYMRSTKANLPLKLEGTKNTRELGGYPTAAGGNTAGGQFLRSDDPSRLTEADIKRLYDYGVRLVIDFRSESEAEQAPSPLIGYLDIEYINPQMLDNIHVRPEPGEKDEIDLPSTLGDMYIGFLENKKDVYLDIIKTVLRHMDDCIFFNCTAGKDRAGTFAMILLKLAGVPDEVVVADYKISGDLVKEEMDLIVENLKTKGIEFDEDMIRSRPVHMQKVLEHLDTAYGSIEKWLDVIGLSGDEIAQLRSKVIGDY